MNRYSKKLLRDHKNKEIYEFCKVNECCAVIPEKILNEFSEPENDIEPKYKSKGTGQVAKNN